MNPATLKRTLGTTAAATALLLVGACGGSSASSTDTSSSNSSSSSDYGPSPTPSSATGSATPTPSGTADTGSATDATALTSANIGQVLSSAQHRAGSFKFRIRAKTSNGSGSQVTRGHGEAKIRKNSAPVARTVMSVRGATMEIISINGLFYMKAPQLLHTKKPWLKIDPKAKSGLGAMLGQLGAGGNPTSTLDVLKGATRVTKLGDAQVQGTPTTKYEVVIPRESLVKAMHYAKQLVQLLPQKFTYLIWVDSHDLVRKLKSAVKVQGNETDTTMTMSGYGTKVSIKAPPAGKVTTKSRIGG